MLSLDLIYRTSVDVHLSHSPNKRATHATTCFCAYLVISEWRVNSVIHCARPIEVMTSAAAFASRTWSTTRSVKKKAREKPSMIMSLQGKYLHSDAKYNKPVLTPASHAFCFLLLQWFILLVHLWKQKQFRPPSHTELTWQRAPVFLSYHFIPYKQIQTQ